MHVPDACWLNTRFIIIIIVIIIVIIIIIIIIIFIFIVVVIIIVINIMQELGPSNELVLCSVLADGVAPEAVLGICPVDVQPESKLASPSRQRCQYWCTASKLGAVDDWGKLLFDSTVEQYGDMCECLHSRACMTCQ